MTNKTSQLRTEILAVVPAIAAARATSNPDFLNLIATLVVVGRCHTQGVETLADVDCVTRRGLASTLARNPAIVADLDQALRAHGLRCVFSASKLVTGKKRHHGGGAQPSCLYVTRI